MLTYLFYWIRYFFWWIGNLRRRLGAPPEYIIFTLEGDYPELPQISVNPLIRQLRPPKISLWELTERFRMIAADPRVKGIVLHIRPLSLTLAKLDVLRDSITNLRESGKRVIAWSYTYDTSLYYLACAADDILLLPGGALNPMGIYRQYSFLADSLARVGVQAEFVQITPYKSAGDQLSRREMSDEVREMSNWLADATYDEIIRAIAEGRKLDLEAAKALIDQTPMTDIEAKESGAIDDLLGEDDIPNYLQDGEKPVRLVTWGSARNRLFRLPLPKPGKYVALMSIEGMIIDGRSQSPPMQPPIPVPLVLDDRAGDLSVVQTTRQILNDKRAAAVVLFVDSRGGSATASESMRIALEKVAAQKPLVVVMGSVAASGGYWVSTPGKLIVTQPNTITGSIGVLSGKVADVGLVEKLLINQETISRGKNIRMYEPEAPFTEAERAKVWAYIQRVYEMFLERVSASRKLDRQDVDAIGGGRVWTGRQALDNGLVDQLGGLAEGLKKARELAELEDRSAVRFFIPGKQYLPPLGEASTILKYGLDGLSFLSARALCLCPWLER